LSRYQSVSDSNFCLIFPFLDYYSDEYYGFEKHKDHSASAIANRFPEDIYPFSQILYNGGFIPNERLRNLSALVPKTKDMTTVMLLASKISGHLMYPLTFIAEHATESILLDPAFQLIALELVKLQPTLRFVTNAKIAHDWFAQGTKQEPVFSVKKNGLAYPVVVTSECKGFEASTVRCFAQAFISAANAALMLASEGLPIEQCVVPAICFAGDGLRFVAVYLVEKTWPVMVVLTDAIDLLGENQSIAAWWLLKLMRFGNETADLLL
jgi:hypothetical protein